MTREEICNSMTVQDAIQMLKETKCFGTMDIAKSVIIKALEQQPSENEKIIKIKKGTLKARTGRFVIYDVEWLKTHFNTTEAKIYGHPNEDCISRKAVLDLFNKSDYYNWEMGLLKRKIEKLPPVTPQPEERTETHACDKKGRWITQWNGAHQKEYYYCSECREEFSYDGETEMRMNDYKYCPNCGAKMQEVKE